MSENKCRLCDEWKIKSGDDLFIYHSNEMGDIYEDIYERISNIQFCPRCGKKLLTDDEIKEKIREQWGRFTGQNQNGSKKGE